MDSSSSIRPEASTVHRAASTGGELPTEDGSRADAINDEGPKNQSIQNQSPAENPVEPVDDIEGAETVIRQGFFDGMSVGSSRRMDDRRREQFDGRSPSDANYGDPRYSDGGRDGGRDDGESRGSSRSHVAARPGENDQADRGVAGRGVADRGVADRNPLNSTPASLTRELQGQRLNHFELLEQIGGGGMGAVFRARDERLGRTVAVKVVPFAAGDPDLQRRFRNEAQSAAKLDHPLIARVFEVGNDGPWYYIVFEYIDGANIRDIVSQNGALPLDDAVYYTCQVAEAIGHASKRGIVHRDIKPSNVVVTEVSSIKLVDMGLARSESFETSEDMTASGVTLGTFDYISPEQAHDPRSADIRSDLYSLGCTFFFMLTGSPPFPGGTMLQKLLNHGNAAIPDVRDRRDDASEDLNAILQKMLAKQPDQRYQDSSVLIADLRELALREELPRSSGVDVVAVQAESRFLQAFYSHLPWVVASTILLLSAGWIEISSWQQRSDFSSQLAATVPSSAVESLPVQPTQGTSLSTSPFGELLGGELLGGELRGGNSPGGDSPGRDSFAVGSRPTIAFPKTDLPMPGGMLRPGGDATMGLSPAANAIGGDPSLTAMGTLAFADPLGTASNPSNLATGRPSPLEEATAAMEALIADDATGLNSQSTNDSLLSNSPSLPSGDANPNAGRLPSDPPSFQGFPLPTTTNDGQPGGDPRAEFGSMTSGDELSDRAIAEMMLSDATNGSAIASVITPTSPTIPSGLANGNATSISGSDPIGTGLLANSIPTNLVRIIDPATVLDNAQVEHARAEGIAIAVSLRDAIEIARNSGTERIEIATPVLICDPVVIQQDDLVIASAIPGGTAVVFRSANDVDMQRSEMISIGSNRIEFVDMHFYWTVPVTETDGGCLLSLTANRQVRMTDCSVTIDNPSRRDEIFAFNVMIDSESSLSRLRSSNASVTAIGEEATGTLPLVSIELYNVIVRGEISMLRMDQAAELQLLWENGLLAVSGRMIETGGSVQRPQPKFGSMRLSLQRLTAYTPRGLLQMRLNSNTAYPVEIERRADESVFVVDTGVPHVEITGTLPEDRDTDWLRIRGSSNAYETDSTLSDPLLVIRDTFGQSNTTTMNDLADDELSWADDRTPRWVVRWTDPLPDSISPSRMIPADFRQDGSLFAGFQERSLPKMPMQRTFDIPPYE